MIAKAILRSFDAGAYRATVQMDGSLGVYLSGVPVSRAIPGVEMVAGRVVAVLFFTADDPEDALVLSIRS